MKVRASGFASTTLSGLGAVLVATLGALTHAASLPPLSGSWNIQPSGSAQSSGELLFRVTPGNTADDPIEVTVPVLAGSSEVAIARKIQSTLATQLRADRYNVTLGQGANVLVTDQHGRPSFALELLTSDVENLRVAVQSTQPTAAPTVPAQTVPSTAAPPPTPPGPGNNLPPTEAPPAEAPPAGTPPSAPATSPPSPGANPPPAPPGATPDAPPPGTSAPASPNPAPPPNTTGGAGQPASAPPPG